MSSKVIIYRMIYAAYGLKIRSDIELPLIKSDTEGNADCVVQSKKTPSHIDPVINKGVYFQANNDEFLLQVPGAGTIFVHKGREIWMDAEPGQQDMLKLYLLSSALGALFHQRGMLSLHASCVSNGEQTILLTGLSGAGKSTVSGALLQEGYQLVSDDICLLTEKQDNYEIEPGAPYLKLWQDTLEKLKIGNEGLQRIRAGIEKYFYLPEYRNGQSLPVTHVFALHTHNLPDPEITALKGMQKFNVMKNNLFRPNMLKNTEHHPAIFQRYNHFLSQVRVFHLKRPTGHQIHPQLIRMILHAVH